MTREEKQIAIYNACGWVDVSNSDWCESILGRYESKNSLPVKFSDPFTDLNAMHEAWLTLPPSKRDRFESELYSVVIGDSDYNRNDDAGWITNATAEQRAEAFGLTLSLWTP